jgi:hypothetical protein
MDNQIFPHIRYNYDEWLDNDDKNKDKVCQVDLNNFGTKSDLRDKRDKNYETRNIR